MKDRIRRIRKDMNMNQTEFGAEIGATQKMVTTYETGAVIPDKSIRLLICQKFNVNLAWLEDGVGEMHPVSAFPARWLTVMQKYPALRAMLEEIDEALGLEGWQMLNQVVERAIEMKNKKESQ